MPPRKPELTSPTVAVPVPAPHALVSSSQDLLTNPNKPSLMMTRWVRDSFLPALPTPLLTVRSRSTWKTNFSKLFKGKVSDAHLSYLKGGMMIIEIEISGYGYGDMDRFE